MHTMTPKLVLAHSGSDIVVLAKDITLDKETSYSRLHNPRIAGSLVLHAMFLIAVVPRLNVLV